MFKDYGLPPTAAATQSKVEQRLKELREGAGVAETLTVEWRGAPLHVEVIDMPLADLYYNPSTHRIRAQRDLEPSRDAALAKDPWSTESQAYLGHLLKVRPSEPGHRDPAFEDLKAHLNEHKQIEPGLITRDGILVNGNTRCAALRELNTITSIRVGILPESCTWDDINDVELSLQLRFDKRRDYSYINRLLAIEEQRVVLHRDLSVIAKAFHTDVRSCERDLWILAQLKDLIARSATDGGPSLRLMDLEGAQERLYELYRVYRDEHAKNKERADILKESRLAAIVLNFSKTDVRYIDPDFQKKYLDKTLPDELKPAKTTASAKAIPGLGRSVQAEGAEVAAARALSDKLLRAKAVEVAGEAATPQEHAAAAAVIASYKGAFNDAIERAGRDFRLRKKRLAAPDRINDACKDLELSITDLVMSRGSSSLDEDAFDDALQQLRTVLGSLAFEAKRTVELPGKGLDWLITAVDAKGSQP
ncbi:transcriptional regulator [Nocardia sp. NPDC051832]|uniref:transcriptional regulator n=1 Tax=Nocardia sp. NPDC051832 TaxID=3155673 RepID=UPI00343199D8